MIHRDREDCRCRCYGCRFHCGAHWPWWWRVRIRIEALVRRETIPELMYRHYLNFIRKP